MSKHIKKCRGCDQYTLKDKCCGNVELPKPPKFSLEDKYADYRRKEKITELKKKGLY